MLKIKDGATKCAKNIRQTTKITLFFKDMRIIIITHTHTNDITTCNNSKNDISNVDAIGAVITTVKCNKKSLNCVNTMITKITKQFKESNNSHNVPIADKRYHFKSVLKN